MSGKRSRKAVTPQKHGPRGKHGKHEASGDFGGAEGAEKSAAAGPSKGRLLLKVGTSALAIFRAVKRVRRTTGRADKLLAADAVAGLLPMITAVAIVVRQLRRKPQSAHATP
ncbi:hypothetical protein OHT52_13775 [Streptomyces sp. NBC_00247]|uniref:hypothetical protein n=1 Tax=Streptomyces sp. NBC_00247 TaxID=2975689 RepID=UPI002E28EFF4|nr:hypothetical protein [Streptomyces sp. NBC_00247]